MISNPDVMQRQLAGLAGAQRDGIYGPASQDDTRKESSAQVRQHVAPLERIAVALERIAAELGRL